jgi:hypothetical protein
VACVKVLSQPVLERVKKSKTLTIMTCILASILTLYLPNAMQDTRTRRWVADGGSEDKMCFHMCVSALCLHNEGLHNFFTKHYRTIQSGKIGWTGHEKAGVEKIKMHTV